MAAPAPTYTSMSPVNGTSLGGTAITITGTGFTGATLVTLGGTACTSLVVVSDTSITAVTPAHAAGIVDLIVTAPGGTVTGTNAFVFFMVPHFVDFAATVRTRLLANAAILGGVQQVLDRDEDPAIIAKNSVSLPTICVIPIGEGRLSSGFTMGGDDMEEDFTLHIVGYYRFSTDNKSPYSDITAIRQYGTTAMRLFNSQSNRQFNSCVIVKATVEYKPYELMDMVLGRWLLTLFVKTIEL
jgi:hypothetical protein